MIESFGSSGTDTNSKQQCDKSCNYPTTVETRLIASLPGFRGGTTIV
ncbi:hypothetical protein NIES2104_41950 [Leptolyngbya sp. NIES-2104]|nr:hypothetical protein NIES2104_41950 [Leptolyngbya sp. NIES-2104]